MARRIQSEHAHIHACAYACEQAKLRTMKRLEELATQASAAGRRKANAWADLQRDLVTCDAVKVLSDLMNDAGKRLISPEVRSGATDLLSILTPGMFR